MPMPYVFNILFALGKLTASLVVANWQRSVNICQLNKVMNMKVSDNMLKTYFIRYCYTPLWKRSQRGNEHAVAGMLLKV